MADSSNKKSLNFLNKKVFFLAAVISMVGILGYAQASKAVFPSTNAQNRAEGLSYVEVTDNTIPGGMELSFVSTKNKKSCFEYRSDGDPSQAIVESHPNQELDGYYADICVQNETKKIVVMAESFTEVRLSYGDDPSERFDWTDFNIANPLSEEVEEDKITDTSSISEATQSRVSEDNEASVKALKSECKNGGWEAQGFRNQGQCIRYVNTGQDSRKDEIKPGSRRGSKDRGD